MSEKPLSDVTGLQILMDSRKLVIGFYDSHIRCDLTVEN